MTITWKGSPNYDRNRKPIDRIVIHWFGVGTLEGANIRFQKASEQASAHYGISGSRVWQWVKEENVAYHAGNYAMNQRSIGIEHDAGINPAHDLSDESYTTSGKLIAEICKRHNIPIDREHIIAHKEVKPTQCPGTIDINRLIYIAKGGEDIVFTDQTKIPIGKVGSGKDERDFGEVELQALRSILGDMGRNIRELNERVVKLEEQGSHKGFVNPIASLLYQLALQFEKQK